MSLDVLWNGEKVACLAANTERVEIPVKQTGDFVLEIRFLDSTVFQTRYHVISSAAQYRDNLKNALYALFMLPAFSVGLMSIPVAGGIMILGLPVSMAQAFVDVFRTIFDFVHIAR